MTAKLVNGFLMNSWLLNLMVRFADSSLKHVTHPVLFSFFVPGEMFTAASTNSAAEYGVTMDSPLFVPRHSPAEERLKRRLRFFFLNPVQKWAATKRFPFKLFTQIIKIIFVTVQVIVINY